jgi:hypothetical protein
MTFRKLATKEFAGATHNVMGKGAYMFKVPDYHSSITERQALLDGLYAMRKAGTKWAIMENIAPLNEDALTRVRFDVDVHLDTDAPDAMSGHVRPFINTLYDVLQEYTGLNVDSRVIVLEKPLPTKGKGDFKHGFKVTCVDLVATHAQMRQLSKLLNQRYHEWGNEAWLKGKSAEESKVLDPVVHERNGWLMYGSQKDEQPAPYTSTRMCLAKDCEAPSDLADYSFRDLQQLLTIFPMDEPGEETWTALKWTKTPPEDTYQSGKRAKSKSKPRAGAPEGVDTEVQALLRKIGRRWRHHQQDGRQHKGRAGGSCIIPLLAYL